MHEPMTTDLLDELGAAARLDARIHALATEVSSPTAEEQWMRPGDMQNREALLRDFFGSGAGRPPLARRAVVRGTLIIMMPLLAAAMFLLIVMWPDGHDSASLSSVTAQDEALGYVLSVEGHAVAHRDSSAGNLDVFRSGDRVTLRLTPREPVHRALGLRVMAAHAERQIELAWPWRMDPAEGIIEVHGSADELLRAAPGVWVLSVELHDAELAHEIRQRLLARLVVSP